jgi:4-alpha-glucanotransferase
MIKRSSGILMHITSLPSPYGIGDFGPEAYRFADFLSGTHQGFWQVLPLNPTSPVHGNSPYAGLSTFAGNVLLISPEKMVDDGLLHREDLEPVPAFPEDRVDYNAVITYKMRLLETAYRRRKERKRRDYDYERFSSYNYEWLEDFSLFGALKAHFNGKPWNEWPREIRDRENGALEHARKQFEDLIAKEVFFQYVFFKQWTTLRSYCNKRGIQIVGDLPIYVNYDSADVWAHQHLFKLNEDRRPCCVSGVPPDYFSATGQLWGNPVYNWQALQQTGYQWWIDRLAHMLRLFNVIRIDHFRGLVAYWEIPAHEHTAVNGHWVDVPTVHFFNTLLKHFANLPIIVEDLGMITPDVREIVRKYEFPGMKVLLFAFGEENPTNLYLPHMYEGNSVAYTGTHDTNTALGWYEHETSPEIRRRLFRYIGRDIPDDQVHWEMIRLIMVSRSALVLLPLQDILGLGSMARMNRPSTGEGNWQWRLLRDQITPEAAEKLREMTYVYGRG